MDQYNDVIEQTGIKQETARIIAKEGLFYSVNSSSGIYSVKRAVSCLVEPQTDDLVLITTGDYVAGFILAVLERNEGSVTTLQFDGDVEISSSTGKIGIHSPKCVDISSSHAITLTSEELQCSAVTSSISSEQLSVYGTAADFCVDKIKTVAQHIETFVKHLFSRSEQSFKFVDELDMVKSGQIDYQAEKTFQARGSFTQITAKDDIHIDGKRINVG